MTTGRGEYGLRRQITEICHRMYAKGYIASGDGNVSARLSPRYIVATPTGVNKGFIGPDDCVVVDMQGKPRDPSRRASTELRMHLACYESRPDVNAVVHAHPPYAIAFSLAGVALTECMLPEVVTTLGSIPTLAYTTPTTGDVPAMIREPVKRYNAMILERHGSLCVGKSLDEAFNYLETMEHTAKILHVARAMGEVRALPEAEVNRLLRLGPGDYAAPGAPRGPAPQGKPACEVCVTEERRQPPALSAEEEHVVAAIVEKVLARLVASG